MREAIQYLGKTVPKSEHLHPKVQTAATCVTDAAEGRDFMMHARIAVIQAIHRNDGPRVINPDREDTHWGKRKLKRDE